MNKSVPASSPCGGVHVLGLLLSVFFVCGASGPHGSKRIALVPDGSRLLRVADLDGDGMGDKLLLTPDGELVPALNRGFGQFEPLPSRLQASAARSVLVADLNDDGFQDLYLVASGRNRALLGDGTGMLREATQELGLQDRGDGLSAELMDLDGQGGLELVLHNAEGDVVFWRQAGAFERDPDSPELPVKSAPQPMDPDEPSSVSGIASDVSGPSIVEEHERSPRSGGGVARTSSAEGASSTTGRVPVPVPSSSSTLLPISSSLDGRYVNDDLGEVDSADVADGSLTGADVSTSEGDVTHTDGNVGIGTSTPQALLHVVGEVSGFPGLLPGKGEVVVSGTAIAGVDGDAEVRLTAKSDGAQGMGLHYDGTSLDVVRTLDGGETYEDPHVRIDETTGFVGIGQSAPLSELHVTGRGQSCEVTLNPQVSNSSSSILFAEGPNSNYGMRVLYDGGPDNALEIWSHFPGGSTKPIVSISRDDRDMTVDGEVQCDTLRIIGGSDLAEPFATAGPIEPGTVVVIDPENEGRLIASGEAYDRSVAGVVSGAGGVNPGLSLQQDGVLEGDTLVALTGRVYVKASAEAGPIRPGDRLTTASLAGHAMRVTDEERSAGAVIGKAMSSLDEGTGLVLVLVNLQ